MAYREALDFFIAEEQEHARLMGEVLDRMNAPRLRWHWSDWAFERVRRLLGLRMEVMVLLVAEEDRICRQTPSLSMSAHAAW